MGRQEVPFDQSYWVEPRLVCAGCYPGAEDENERDQKLRGLIRCGIRRVLSLMEEDEHGHAGRVFVPYECRLNQLAGGGIECDRLPIVDASAPDAATMDQILDWIDMSMQQKIPSYVHCWGGHGRTSTVVACYLIRLGSSAEDAMRRVLTWRDSLPKSHYPFEGEQEDFIVSFAERRLG